MKTFLSIALCLLCAVPSPTKKDNERKADLYTEVRNVSAQELAENFKNAPTEFASHHVIYGWEGDMDKSLICRDLDSIKAKGFNSVIFEAGYHLPFEYLSEGWFKAIKTAVKEAKKRDLKVWIIDEGKYPSGFAGGKFSREAPELRMQAVVSTGRDFAPKWSTIKDETVPEGTVSAYAVSRSGAPGRSIPVTNGKFGFEAGNDDWDIYFAGTDYRTGQTRAVNDPTGAKTTKNSLCDYLNPVAVRQFIDWTHEQYKKYIGSEFGKTVLGFRGDEPDFAYTPWTPEMAELFRSRKGYDPTPYLACLTAERLSVTENRFRADYWDVWSELFAENFFAQQAEWCAENGLSYVTHLNNDHNMPVCVRAEGSLFRDLSVVQVPGVDAIWNQIWPGTTNDFPKYASSVSHVYGKPRAFSESFAAYYTSPNMEQAKFVVDYQLVRGINFFEFMFWMAGSESSNWMTDPGMFSLNEYTSRACYLNSKGVPGARVAVYHPTSTFWLGNNAVEDDLKKISDLLLKHQFDFDWIDDDALCNRGTVTIAEGKLVNLSGQPYETLIIPSCDVISSEAWNSIMEFRKAGGKVLFYGRRPTMLSGLTFRNPIHIPDAMSCLYEPSVSWTSTVEAAMPKPEFKIILPEEQGMRPAGPRRPSSPQKPEPEPWQDIRYTRRVLSEGSSLYFIFNEGDKEYGFDVELDSESSSVKEWDARSGEISTIESHSKDGKTTIHISLPAYGSTFVTVEK